MPITIVVADDHRLMRQGLRSLLEAEADFTVIGEAADGRETLAIVERRNPDVLILDLILPDMNGLEVMRILRERNTATRVIILSMHAAEPYVREALKSGAMGYVLKEVSMEALALAVRTVSQGLRYLGPPLTERAIDAYLQEPEPPSTAVLDPLTEREREVLQLVLEGLSAVAIAERLAISPRTVETHRAHLLKKLGLHNQKELVRFALRHRMLPREG